MINDPQHHNISSEQLQYCDKCAYPLRDKDDICKQCGVVREKNLYRPFWLAKINFLIRSKEDEKKLLRRWKILLQVWPLETRGQKKIMMKEADLIADQLYRRAEKRGPFYWQKQWDKEEIDDEHPLMVRFFSRLLIFQNERRLVNDLRDKQIRAAIVGVILFIAALIFKLLVGH
jgi:hypothetical protein